MGKDRHRKRCRVICRSRSRCISRMSIESRLKDEDIARIRCMFRSGGHGIGGRDRSRCWSRDRDKKCAGNR